MPRIKSRYTKDNILCPDHKLAFDLPDAHTGRPTEELDEDDPIECDACSMMKMRQLGAI